MIELIDLAISMTEIDTGIELSIEEREKLTKIILNKIKNFNE